MIARETTRLVLVSVGNTRTRISLALGGQLEPSRVLKNDDPGAILDAILREAGETDDAPLVLMASVNRRVSDDIAARLKSTGLGDSVLIFGPDLPVPIVDAVEERESVGIDRLFNALGAFARTSQACIVIDAGTATTVDFVDGTGVFQGGAIGPGVQMMLDAMHEHTDALPSVRFDKSDLSKPACPFGKNTGDAMLRGVIAASRGLVRALIDEYAEFYEAYPLVVATGGDAPALFQDDPLIERIVPDLTLVGMLAAYERLRDAEDE